MHEFHGSPIGGHLGAYKTYRQLAVNVYWPGMIRQVTKFVAECLICQQNKYDTRRPPGQLQPLPIPANVWEDISMDFIAGLARNRSADCILVVADRFSKYAHFIELSHPFTVKQVAGIFAREVVRLHGIPRSIVSDHDRLFVSSFWSELFRACETKLRMSSAYHQETDGQTEVLNRCLETYLRCFAGEHPKSWSSWLPWTEYGYNTRFHSASGRTPFEVVYGRRSPTLHQFFPEEIKVKAVADELLERDEMLRQLKWHLERAQQRMVKAANKHRRHVELDVGTKVLLKLNPRR